MKNVVTIVLPAYNASEYLSETINSVLSQTFPDFELLVIDDGSTDNTTDIVRDFCQRDSRMRLISQKNQGVSVARNTGIKMAQGEFIAFIDSDDLWMPNKLAMHVQHLRANPNLGLSYARVEFMTFDGKPTGKYSNPRLVNISAKDLYEENAAVTPSNAVISRTALEQVGGFDGELSGAADAELFLRVKCHGWQVEGIDQVLVLYRTSLGGMSSQLYKMEEDWNLLSQKAQVYAPELIKHDYKQARAMLLRYLARRTLRLELSSELGIKFMNRALKSEWTLIFKEPRRTILTAVAVYGKFFISSMRGSNS
ncbi:glycosyl transferase [Rivularia sp. PCC 7116]|uniref:glycosyltransferase family 2 protein n=1 Tax=Rivularia sp. PCC 7116 TaxID=373994 RepID=UPI00029ED11E|nr:glycosyltransferase family A protein [Rivularia sp. PCC 7116]AFY54576.1 glycosyl transferase [Rivularia sp. PCC 7116]